MMKHLGAIAGVLSLAVVAGAPAATASNAVDTSISEKADSWGAAADELGPAGSLWEPGFSAGLARKGAIDVSAADVTVRDGVATGGSTFAGGKYGSGGRSFDLVEKWGQTDWAADPQTDIRRLPVGTVTIRLGSPGMRIPVKATVFANCYTEALTGNAPVPTKSMRCTKDDVRKYGGTLRMTAKPASTMTGPGVTTLQIDSTGLTYAQLLRVASSLDQIAGTPSIEGSAQMRGMCAQMVDGKMSESQARAFAEANGFVLRVGSIDGQPQMVTKDFRPDRFTVDLVSGAVTGCSYG
ncbi:MAG TPA: hypothetical protein DCQ36_08160 [Actinobacteria bacterium]|jgi:hypothetical protein|nr:hypothetical protein [Actinomycetota bacterium]